MEVARESSPVEAAVDVEEDLWDDILECLDDSSSSEDEIWDLAKKALSASREFQLHFIEVSSDLKIDFSKDITDFNAKVDTLLKFWRSGRNKPHSLHPFATLIGHLTIRELEEDSKILGSLFCAELHKKKSDDAGIITYFTYSIPQQNSIFCGRKDQFLEVFRYIQSIDFCSSNQSSPTKSLLAITGPPGIGKTEFTKKLIKVLQPSVFGNLVWINAESYESLKSGFIGLANDLEVPIQHGANEREIKSIVKDCYLKFGKSKSVFVLDNADSCSALTDFFPPNSSLEIRIQTQPLVILTSVNQNWDENKISIHQLDVLTEEEGLELLDSCMDSFETKTRDKLLKVGTTMGYYTLGLRQAAAYINMMYRTDPRHRSPCPIESFLLSYEEEADRGKSQSFLDYEFWRRTGTDSYSKSIFICIKLVLQKLESTFKDSISNQICFQKTLSIIGFCVPVYIPNSLLYGSSSSLAAVATVIDSLVDFSIIQRCTTPDSRLISVHQLIQKTIRHLIVDPEEALLNVCHQIEPYLQNSMRDFRNTELIAHLNQILPSAINISNYLIETLRFGTEFNNFLHIVLYTQFLLFQKENAYEFAKKVREGLKKVIPGPVPHEIHFLWENNFGICSTSLHRHSEATEVYAGLLGSACEKLTRGHPVALMIANGYGNLCSEINQLSESWNIHSETADYLKGQYHLSAYYALVGKAIVEQHTGKLKDAMESYERGISCANETFGPWGIQTVIAKFLAGSCLGTLDENLEEALRIMQELTDVLGKPNGLVDHQLHSWAQGKVREYLIKLNRTDEASAKSKKIPESAKTELDPNDTFYIRQQKTIATILHNTIPKDPCAKIKVQIIYEEIIPKMENLSLVPAPMHPRVLETKLEYANIRYGYGDFKNDAKVANILLTDFTEIHAAQREINGPDHAFTLETKEKIKEITKSLSLSESIPKASSSGIQDLSSSEPKYHLPPRVLCEEDTGDDFEEEEMNDDGFVVVSEPANSEYSSETETQRRDDLIQCSKCGYIPNSGAKTKPKILLEKHIWKVHSRHLWTVQCDRCLDKFWGSNKLADHKTRQNECQLKTGVTAENP